MAANIHIENVVASATIGDNLNLPEISKKLPNAEYDAKQFPGLVYRLDKPKTASLLFKSGKIVCTGAKSLDEVHTAIKTVIKNVKKTGAKVTTAADVTVQNIVASADIGAEINLNAIAISLGLDKVEYEPEQFPGLVYRLTDPKVVVLLFSSGKLVCTGAKTVEDIDKAVKKITKELKSSGLL